MENNQENPEIKETVTEEANPEQKNKQKKKHPIRNRVLAISLPIIVFIVACVYLFLPQPYYVEMPGSTMPLSEMVKVEGEEPASKGNFYLTTVNVAQANNAMILASKANPFASVYSAKDMTGGLSDAQFNAVNRIYMQTAQNMAVMQAFKLANKPYEMDYQGVYVQDVAADSSFKDDLAIGDVLTKVNGKTFKSSTAMREYIASHKVGETLSIEYTNTKGHEEKASGKLMNIGTKAHPRAGIGIILSDKTELKTDPSVKIDAGAIGGPSAGMMFTLEIYSQITSNDLLRGRQIAGTGTINEDGTIGQIGGVDKKVATASKEGAEIFLVPDSGSKKVSENNYLGAKKAARRLDTKMQIIPVKTIHDAISSLEDQSI